MPHIVLPKMPCGKTPVVIVSTRNPDRSVNLAVCSDIVLLDDCFTITLPIQSQTTGNVLFEKECVVNIPPQDLAPALERLIKTTVSRKLAATQQEQGLRYVRAKFAEAKLTPCRSMQITTAGVEECPLRVEAEFVRVPSFRDLSFEAIELRVLRVIADTSVIKAGTQHEIDMEKWQPLQSSSRDLILRPGENTQLKDRAGDDDEAQKEDLISIDRASHGLQTNCLTKIKATQARYPVLAYSPSGTPLRAIREVMAINERDTGDKLPSEANASEDVPTDLGDTCLCTDMSLVQVHAVALVLGWLLLYVWK
ncbi:MAG: hypothetical protein Q9213_002928 [Squamulea squamosa]